MVWESIDDHSLLLMTDRYNRCRQYDSQNYHHWLVEIKRAGNASAKDYVKSYEGIIRKYWLYLYDQMAMGVENGLSLKKFQKANQHRLKRRPLL